MTQRLIFADVDAPGISRRRVRARWAYFGPEGERITDRDEIERLNGIALPPAYTDAWFSPDAQAHILATGVDDKGRKQYRYHPAFVAGRDAIKFERCADFGRALPRIRQRVEADLAERGLTEERAIASVIRLLDSGRIRVGNECYARSNRSFGATTLLHRHVRLNGQRLTLRFRAKSGKLSTFDVTDRGLVRFVKRVQDLPGQHLFQYIGEGGQTWPINSTDVNRYIRETMKADFSAKDFRTWAASVLAFQSLLSRTTDMKLADLLSFVADHLGNTPAIARKAYVHPSLIELARTPSTDLRALKLPRCTKWLSREERGLIAYLDKSACNTNLPDGPALSSGHERLKTAHRSSAG